VKSPSILVNTVVVTATAFVIFCQTALAAPLELTLDESIALTYKNNPALQIVEARQEQSVWALKEAQTNKNLSLDYTHTDMRSNSPPTTPAAFRPTASISRMLSTDWATVPRKCCSMSTPTGYPAARKKLPHD